MSTLENTSAVWTDFFDVTWRVDELERIELDLNSLSFVYIDREELVAMLTELDKVSGVSVQDVPMTASYEPSDSVRAAAERIRMESQINGDEIYNSVWNKLK